MLPNPSSARWMQLPLGLVVMAISSPRYFWTPFVKSFQGASGAGLPGVRITFWLPIVSRILFSPAQGWLVDRFGPRLLGAARTQLGAGIAMVYLGIVGRMARWFPKRGGFAIELVAAG